MSNVFITNSFWHVQSFNLKKTYIYMWSDLLTSPDWSNQQSLTVLITVNHHILPVYTLTPYFVIHQDSTMPKQLLLANNLK